LVVSSHEEHNYIWAIVCYNIHINVVIIYSHLGLFI
jgi:hypothetical protein